MQQGRTTLATFYKGWDEYQRMLVKVVAPLSAEQLALKASSTLRPAWLIAAHIVGTRVGWFQGWMGEGDPELVAFDSWDEDGAPPRTAAELVRGLEATWTMIQGCLDRWTPAMLDDPITRMRRDKDVTFTRQWIIWHVIEHDMHHGGELFLTLGAHGLSTPDF